MEILKHAHSGLRWLVLIALIIAIINALKGGVFSKKDKTISLIALIFTHIQFVLGLALYAISPLVQFGAGTMKQDVLRFYTVEHVSMMVVAVVLITIGYSRSKKLTADAAKFKSIWILYLIGLLIMLAAIPWPFRNLGGTWF